MLRDAGRRCFGCTDVVLEAVSFREMLALPEGVALRVQIVFTEHAPDGAAATIYSRPAGAVEGAWSQHVTAHVAPAPGKAPHVPLTLTLAREQCREPESPEAFYARLAERALDFGSLFRGIVELRSGECGVLGRVRLSSELCTDKAADTHPVLLDACLQLLGVAVTRRGFDETYMQVTLARMHFVRSLGKELWGYAALRQAQEGSDPIGDVYLFDEQGVLIGALEGIGLKRVPLALLADATATIPHPEWLYEVVWRRATHGDADWTLPELDVLAEPLRTAVGPLSAKHGLDAFAVLSPQMERASALFIARALEKMECRLQPGARVSTDTLRRDSRVLPSFQRLFVRMLAILEEEAVLRRVGADEWEAVAKLPQGDGNAECRRLLEAYPDYRAELTLLARCGDRLAEVLQGSQDPLQLLFPEGDPAALEGLYRDSPSARVFNRIVQRAAAELAAHHKEGRALRVLEIGAGTGSTTQYVLPALPPETEYLFTDISPLFVSRAAEMFSQRTSMEFRVFDVDDKTPLEQGLKPGSFDLIVAANVLHATRDLRRTVGRVRELLRPGGVLLLLEGTRALRWVDLTFGMTEGWWRFTDRELRPQHALLAPAQWRGLLESSGFDQTAAAPESVEAAGQTVLLARAALQSAEASAPEAQPRWLLCTHDLHLGREAAAACTQAGIEVRLASTGSAGAQPRSNEYPLSGLAATDVSSAFAQLAKSGFEPTALVLLATVHGADDPVEAASKDCLLATTLLNALPHADSRVRLWVVTRGAQSVSARALHFEHAALWGWGRVAALEQPERFGGLIDLDPNALNFDVPHLRTLIGSDRAEDQIALRDGETRVPRLVRASIAPARAFQWCRDRAYVVTGWMGGLGLLLVQWLVGRGVRHLVLIGRRDPEAGGASCEEARDLLQHIRTQGVTATLAVGDVADAECMGQLFSRFGRDLPAIAGVFHVAAHLDARPIAALDSLAVREMMRPKASGAWVLHQLTKDLPLDCFVLFSSTTALWGAQGLAHYAAANQFLDALAQRRHAAGLPALSVNWGTWAAMRLASDEARELYASAGLERMSAPGALAMLDAALAIDAPQATIAAVNWDLLKPVYEARRARPFFSEVGVLPDRRTKQATREAKLDEAWTFEDVPEAERKEILGERVRSEVAAVLGLGNAADVDPTRGLFDLGMDSLMAVELRARLQKRAGCALPSTLTFNYPNAAALTQFLERLLFALPSKSAVAASAGSSRAATPAVLPNAAERDEMSEDELEQLLAERLRTL
jgi:SAM-dependent methyltransferase/acyl carrier protein/NAD(P)-dependent dehydrogenase (short-subunit alcohol dehydrogenase family)